MKKKEDNWGKSKVVSHEYEYEENIDSKLSIYSTYNTTSWQYLKKSRYENLLNIILS